MRSTVAWSRAPNAAADSAGSGSSGGVTVLKSEVVGPYETVQLRSTDPEALAKLTARRKSILDDVGGDFDVIANGLEATDERRETRAAANAEPHKPS